MKPMDAIELEKVPLAHGESYPPEGTLPEDRLYHYLLQPGDEHDDKHKRATDRIWSEKTYRLSKIVSSASNQVMYHLTDGLESFFEGRADAIPLRHRAATGLCTEVVIPIPVG